MAKSLHILIQNRPDTATHPGGDTVQMERTAQFLRDIGHRVEISCELEPDLSPYDVIHLFNLTRPAETAVQAENARRQRKPRVLSSVYWDLESAVPWSGYEFPRSWYRLLIPEGLRSGVRKLRGRSAGGDSNVRSLQSRVLADSVMVFPNSEAEKQHILDRFPTTDASKLIVIHNGIDPPARSNGESASTMEGAAGAFICAGAIGPRKNQLNLVKAFRLLPKERLLIVGRPSPGSDRYLAATRAAAGSNVSFSDTVDHDALVRTLCAAKAVVQPSYIETPGLSAMEALSLGTPIVVADVAPVREYFGELAHFCSPSSPASIADACRQAAGAARPDGRRFADRYLWNIVLEGYRAAYEKLAASL